MEERNNRLLNAKLNKYIVPGIMMSLALQLGNIVDTIFVSNLIGVEAMSAVTLSLPVETLGSAYGLLPWYRRFHSSGKHAWQTRQRRGIEIVFCHIYSSTCGGNHFFNLRPSCSRTCCQTSGIR